jgi:hypothetical protein
MRRHHGTPVDLGRNLGVWKVASTPLRNAGQIGWRDAQYRCRRPIATSINAMTRPTVLAKILCANTDLPPGRTCCARPCPASKASSIAPHTTINTMPRLVIVSLQLCVRRNNHPPAPATALRAIEEPPQLSQMRPDIVRQVEPRGASVSHQDVLFEKRVGLAGMHRLRGQANGGLQKKCGL